jgi:hypothetical protein
MGGQNSKIDETEIRNEISVSIDVATKNLNKVFNETVTNVSTKMVNETENQIKISATAEQDMNLGNLTADGPGSTIDVTQKAEVKTENQAIMQIMNNNQALNDMQAKIQNELVNKTSNDTAAKASMDTLNALKQSTKDAGGPEAMVKAAMGAIEKLGASVTGTSSKEEKKTKIVNQMKQDLKISTTNSNDISNIVRQSTDSFAANIQKSACKMDTNAVQKLKTGNITARDGGAIKLAQKIDLAAFNKCVVASTNVNEIINKVSGGTVTGVTNDTTNKTSTDTKLKAKNELTQTVENTSSIMDTFKALGMTAMIIPALIGIVVIGGIIYAVSRVMNFAYANPDMVKDAAKEGMNQVKQAQGLPTNDENDNEQAGGAIKKTYDTIFYVLIIIIVLNALIRK